MEPAVVFIGGEPPHPRVVEHLPSRRWVVAADSGLDHAYRLGVEVDLVVGDLDSVSAEGLRAAHARSVPVREYRPDKDATDTDLALDAAVARGSDHVIVVSGVGDRLDHSLAALMALVRPSLAGRRVEAWWGPHHVAGLRGPASHEFRGEPGDLLSLVPVGGDAGGIRTTGLRYPLSDEALAFGLGRGISNEFVADAAVVELETGCLLAVLPDRLGSA